jgi:hypothetical protein
MRVPGPRIAGTATLHIQRFALHVSELVDYEAGRGDPDAARARLEIIKELPVLPVSRTARDLA